MLATYIEAEQRYAAYRAEVQRQVQGALPYTDASSIRLKDIDQTALTHSRLWSQIPERKVDFDWENDCRIYKKRYPKRFELAIWYGSRLESLALGRPSFNGTRVRLELIERIATNSVLKGKTFAITELALMAYAELLGADEVRIMQPINDDVKRYYLSKGYHYVPSTGARFFPDYCVKKL